MNRTTTDVAATLSLTELVSRGRAATAALRKLETSGGGTMATVRAQERHADALRTVHAELVARDQRSLSAALTDEDDTASRLATARAAGQERPELVQRLAAARRTLRSA